MYRRSRYISQSRMDSINRKAAANRERNRAFREAAQKSREVEQIEAMGKLHRAKWR